MRAIADVGARRYRFRLVNLTRRAGGLADLWSFEICRVVYGTNDGKCG